METMSDDKEVWKWLAEAEDNLEKTVVEFNNLAATTDRLERRGYTQEILVRSLRAEKRAKETKLDVVGSEAAALSQLLIAAKVEAISLKEEIKRLRAETKQAGMNQLALTVLVEESKTARIAERTRIQELTLELRQARKRASELEQQDEEQREVIQDQQSAIEEWQQAYAVLQKEFDAFKASTVKKAVPPPPPRPAPPRPHSLAKPVQVLRTEQVKAVVDVSETSPLSSSLKSALKVLSKL